MASKDSQLDRRHSEKKHLDTENTKHRFGGPGKAARQGHLDPQDSGNKQGQEQAGQGHEPRRPRHPKSLTED